MIHRRFDGNTYAEKPLLKGYAAGKEAVVQAGKNKTLVIMQAVLLAAAVVSLSALSSGVWGEKAHTGELPLITPDDTSSPRILAREAHVPERSLMEGLSLKQEMDLDRSLKDLGITPADAKQALTRARAVSTEESSKNWKKIVVKFLLWAAFITISFVLMQKKAMTPGRRKVMYLSALTIFGIVLGSDPNPMGTVKDAIVMYGQSGVVFPPRLIAFAVFMAMVVLANKSVCSWGCQLGTLQDLLFRLNRNDRDSTGIIRQYKVPFAVTNSVRVVFFAALTVYSLVWSLDIASPIDPFKVFRPMTLTLAGAMFAGVVLAASLFVYRPWCHFLCPFGLVGWLGEKISIAKIRVNYDTCISCRACEKACPSTVMGAILKQDRVIPDCFACGSCIDACPTDSIYFDAGKRSRPPQGKFT